MAARLPELPASVSLGLGSTITVVRLGVRAMRAASKCERKDATPDGLWDAVGDRILVLDSLTKRRALEVYFHELTHALVDVSNWVLHP